mmetsp:Transcript_38257/g.83331  ORF Transcript_38257/g.83331 Transcript_38257/m.83331 type:complete len:296 (-) Transcript_38257:50-937(-)
MASAGECVALPEDCLERIAVEFLGWNPNCFTQLLNLRPRLYEQIAFVVLSFDQCIGKMIHVHSDSPGSIATWIAAAPRSSIITLNPGRYAVAERIVITKPVIVHGASNVRYGAKHDYDDDAPAVTITCRDDSSILRFAGDCDGAKIRNISLVFCPVMCSGGSPHIENCSMFVVDNGAVRINGHSKPTVRDCWIHADPLFMGEFGIEVVGQAAPFIMDNRFDCFEEAAIIMREQSSGVVQGNYIAVPKWPRTATAFLIMFEGSRPAQVFDNTVVNVGDDENTFVNEVDDEEGPADD